jgi:hypothetical protein
MTAIMTAHNSRNASNSRNDSKNRTAKTVWTPSKSAELPFLATWLGLQVTPSVREGRATVFPEKKYINGIFVAV